MSPLGPGNSCPLGGAALVVCAGSGDQTYQYRVKIVQKVKNTFGQVLGMDATNVSASATAEYLKPLSMGSPSNQYGNDPDNTSWPINATNPPQTYPNFWGNIEGGGTAKQQGDAYAANWCENGSGGGTDGCNGNGDGQHSDTKLPQRPISQIAVDRSDYRVAYIAYAGFNAATPKRPEK